MSAAVDYAEQYTSARKRVLDALWPLEWVSWKQLHAVAGVRYGARLRELRRLGYQIESEDLAPDGKRYRLVSREVGRAAAKRVRVFLDEHDASAIASSLFIPTTARVAVDGALKSYRANKSKL